MNDYFQLSSAGISTGSSSKTSSESSSAGAVAVRLNCFNSVVIDFRQGALTIEESPEIRAFAVVSEAISAVLSNLRQAREWSESTGRPVRFRPSPPLRRAYCLISYGIVMT
jgi:hypothetical protein